MDETTRQCIVGMARVGCTETTIRQAIGLDATAWEDLKRMNADLLVMIEQGRGQGIGKVMSRVFDKAVEGDMVAAKYYLGQQSTEYRQDIDKATTINVQMPTQREIYAILKSDPAMLDEAIDDMEPKQ